MVAGKNTIDTSDFLNLNPSSCQSTGRPGIPSLLQVTQFDKFLIRNMLQLNQCKLYLLYVLHITIFGRFHHNVHLIVKYYNVQFMYLFIKVTIVIPFLLQIQIVVPFTLHITFLCFPYYEIRLLYRNYQNCCTFFDYRLLRRFLGHIVPSVGRLGLCSGWHGDHDCFLQLCPEQDPRLGGYHIHATWR